MNKIKNVINKYIPASSDFAGEAGEELYGWTKNPTKLQGEVTAGMPEFYPKSNRVALDTSFIFARGGC